MVGYDTLNKCFRAGSWVCAGIGTYALYKMTQDATVTHMLLVLAGGGLAQVCSLLADRKQEDLELDLYSMGTGFDPQYRVEDNAQPHTNLESITNNCSTRRLVEDWIDEYYGEYINN